jgi:hypothetical protein
MKEFRISLLSQWHFSTGKRQIGTKSAQESIRAQRMCQHSNVVRLGDFSYMARDAGIFAPCICIVCVQQLRTGLRYKLLGSVQQRFGGCAVVQFATGPKGDIYALKFCVRKAAFDRVAALFKEDDSNALMPMVKGTVPNNSGATHAGHALPPCIVMHAGEPLESAIPSLALALGMHCLHALSCMLGSHWGECDSVPCSCVGHALPPCIVMHAGEPLGRMR